MNHKNATKIFFPLTSWVGGYNYYPKNYYLSAHDFSLNKKNKLFPKILKYTQIICKLQSVKLASVKKVHSL